MVCNKLTYHALQKSLIQILEEDKRQSFHCLYCKKFKMQFLGLQRITTKVIEDRNGNIFQLL